MEESVKNTFNLKAIFKKIVLERKTYYKVLSIVLILSIVWIFPQPRYYKCSVSLAPESESENAGGSLSSIASSFGVNLGSMSTSDAIYPQLYPEVMSSTDFALGLGDVHIKTLKGDVDTTYFTYLQKHQKISIWSRPLLALRRFKKKLFPPATLPKPAGTDGKIDPFWMSPDEQGIVETITNKITCSVDKKNDVITITVLDQDKLVCATMADSASEYLQKYITTYRTSKARVDVEYYKKLCAEAKQAYEKASATYAAYKDAHISSVFNKFNVKSEELENEMQAKYQEYNALQTQLHAAEAKVQEKTPAFMTLQRASIPIKPAGPKRMMFCFGMLVLGFMGTSIYVLRKEIFG